jgi:hypothetical protein
VSWSSLGRDVTRMHFRWLPPSRRLLPSFYPGHLGTRSELSLYSFLLWGPPVYNPMDILAHNGFSFKLPLWVPASMKMTSLASTESNLGEHVHTKLGTGRCVLSLVFCLGCDKGCPDRQYGSKGHPESQRIYLSFLPGLSVEELWTLGL